MIIEKNSKLEYISLEINQKIIAETFENSKKGNKKVLGIVLATKPCFYKLWGMIEESKKKSLNYIIINTGQHYDDLVGHGIVEFNFKENIAVNLNIRGNLSQKSSEIFSKMQLLHDYLTKNYPEVELIPYVNGDTLTAAIMPLAWTFSSNIKSIQGEAGLRGMSPNSFVNFKETEDYADFVNKQFYGKWMLNRTEPFPEQIDTYISAAGCEYFFTPVKINEEHLIREGYPKKNIFTAGNTVVDVIKYKKNMKSDKSVFDIYPKLEKDEWIRVDIHRRENLTEKRFKSIIGGVTKLVNSGEKVVFIELNASKMALEHYNLRNKLLKLSETNNNFLFTPLWKEYGHVIEFISSKNCKTILTDSGSMQEEMNELQKPCLTMRFSTDRPETVINSHSNILIPPISPKFINNSVKHILKEEFYNSKIKKLYGTNASSNIVKKIKILFDNDERFFSWAHENLNIYKEKKNKFKYL